MVVDVGISDYITAGVVRACDGELVEIMEVSQLPVSYTHLTLPTTF